MSPRITIITGFLGSGKTTLLRAALERGVGRRLALVVNEIGQAGFDGPSLGRAGGPPMVELTGGCICCAAGSDFLVAVEELIATADPDQIVVETTGLAEPGGMIRQARAADLALDAVVTVADAAGLDAALAASPVAEWQIRAADLIVLSKVDRAGPADIARAEARLRTINQRAPLVPAARGAIDPRLLFGPRLTTADPQAAPGHLDLDGFSSFVWEGDAPLRRDALEALFAALPPQIYRSKGVVHCSDAPWPSELHYVGGRLELAAFRQREPSRPLNRLVLIGAGAAGLQGDITDRLRACVEGPDRAAAWERRYRDLF
jgi:G3E family GTPase